MKDWKNNALLLAKEGVNWRQIAKRLNVPKSTVSDFLRPIFKNKDTKLKLKEKLVVHGYDDGEDNSRILLISDPHMPYHHPQMFDFLQYLKDKYKPTRVICLGDEADKHSLSYHDSDPNLMSAGDELEEVRKWVAKLHDMFPKMDILESNHGSMVWRKAKTHGIPRQYIKSYNEVLGVDDGWKWSFDLTINLPNNQKCYFHHGKTSNGIQLSQQMGMSAVQGHYHESFKIDYWGNTNGLFWSMNIGCLIDNDSYAFTYNNVNLKKPIIGTGLIIDSLPVLEPMILDKDGRWVGGTL